MKFQINEFTKLRNSKFINNGIFQHYEIIKLRNYEIPKLIIKGSSNITYLLFLWVQNKADFEMGSHGQRRVGSLSTIGTSAWVAFAKIEVASLSLFDREKVGRVLQIVGV